MIEYLFIQKDSERHHSVFNPPAIQNDLSENKRPTI